MEILTFAAYIVLIPKLIVKFTAMSKNRYIRTELVSMLRWASLWAAWYFIFAEVEYVLPVLIMSWVVQGIFTSDIYDEWRSSVDIDTIDSALFDNNK